MKNRQPYFATKKPASAVKPLQVMINVDPVTGQSILNASQPIPLPFLMSILSTQLNATIGEFMRVSAGLIDPNKGKLVTGPDGPENEPPPVEEPPAESPEEKPS